jgi:hypothetical protein
VKKKRKFSKEAWEKLMSTVHQEKSPEEPRKEESKVEVHIHNNIPGFKHEGNSADRDLERMTGSNSRRFL